VQALHPTTNHLSTSKSGSVAAGTLLFAEGDRWCSPKATTFGGLVFAKGDTKGGSCTQQVVFLNLSAGIFRIKEHES
jgi:hypothetical protein